MGLGAPGQCGPKRRRSGLGARPTKQVGEPPSRRPISGAMRALAALSARAPIAAPSSRKICAQRAKAKLATKPGKHSPATCPGARALSFAQAIRLDRPIGPGAGGFCSRAQTAAPRTRLSPMKNQRLQRRRCAANAASQSQGLLMRFQSAPLPRAAQNRSRPPPPKKQPRTKTRNNKIKD